MTTEPSTPSRAYSPDGRLVYDIRTDHPDLFMVTGVRQRNGHVWIGSVEASTIGRINLA